MKNIGKILFLFIVVAMIWTGVQQAGSYSENEDLQRISDTIYQLSLKCYSIEGKYPQDIHYLKDYYGLLVNEDDYHILYHYEGDNIQPTIHVYKKVKDYE
ncbi:hypothetical protein [Candidatus Stoquefichus sp. SB1]|uniref:hypothetical protein n=1 Tax=Candidatus Stoquefichus sp. SB1 TaxID=1658109 RepID=UPI00067E8868|nr:hypothetical protein [Candidatus Stoquefichus sp. SB1]